MGQCVQNWLSVTRTGGIIVPNQTDGVWGGLQDWPLIGIHSIVTQDGRVLSFGTDAQGMQGGQFIYDVWDPVTGTHNTLSNTTPTDIFCSAAIIIPGTDLVLIGGGDDRPNGDVNSGVNHANVFDSTDMSLTPSATGVMNYARWYPTMVSLPTGQVVIIGGSDGDHQGVGVPEIFTLGEGWRTLDGAADADIARSPLYARSWLNGDGEVVYFAAGRGIDSDFEVMALDPSGNGSVREIGLLPFSTDWNSPAIMYEAGKVLIQATNGDLWTMDITGPTPVFNQTESPSQDRNWANMTVLADGTVLINGGSVGVNTLTGVDTTAAIWSPVTGTISYGADEALARLYHSTTVLLADGTVLSLGGGAPGPLTNTNGEIYRPPYLYDANGNEATRPVILDAPDDVVAGQNFSITLDDASSIAKLTFVKNGATTHGVNMDARMVELQFVQGANNTLIVTLPENANELTAGNWMLFAWDDQGVPSVAPILSVEPTLTLFDGVGDITAEYFTISTGISSLDQIDFNTNPLNTENVVEINETTSGGFYEGGPTTNFAARYTGQFDVSRGGNHTFYLTSDDGSRLIVDGQEVIDNDGLQGSTLQTGAINLGAGTHTIEVLYFQSGGPGDLDLDWAGPGFARKQMQFDGAGDDLNVNVVNDVPGQNQTLTGIGDNDIFSINGNSADYGWGPTLDGTGVVVWTGSAFDLLFGFEEIRFNDRTVQLGSSGNNEYLDEPGTQYITGTSADETFVINGLSSDYNWNATEDGTGFVVWNAQGFDLLFNIEHIRFTDQTVDLANDGTPLTVQDDPNANQQLTGTDGVDRFVIDANSSAYQWGPTEDLAGVVIWNSSGFDILFDFEEIEFNDQVVQLDAPVV